MNDVRCLAIAVSSAVLRGAAEDDLRVMSLRVVIHDRGTHFASSAEVALCATEGEENDASIVKRANCILALLGDRATCATLRRWDDVLTIRGCGADATTTRTKRRGGEESEAPPTVVSVAKRGTKKKTKKTKKMKTTKTVSIAVEWRVARCFAEVGAARPPPPLESDALAMHRFFALFSIRVRFAFHASFVGIAEADRSFVVESKWSSSGGGGSSGRFTKLGLDATRVLSEATFRAQNAEEETAEEEEGTAMVVSTARVANAHARRCTALIRPRPLGTGAGAIVVVVVALDLNGSPQPCDSSLFHAAQRAALSLPWSLLHLGRSDAVGSTAAAADSRDGLYTRSFSLSIAPGEEWEELYQIESMVLLFETDCTAAAAAEREAATALASSSASSSSSESGLSESGTEEEKLHCSAVATATRALRGAIKEARTRAYRGYFATFLADLLLQFQAPHPAPHSTSIASLLQWRADANADADATATDAEAEAEGADPVVSSSSFVDAASLASRIGEITLHVASNKGKVPKRSREAAATPAVAVAADANGDGDCDRNTASSSRLAKVRRKLAES